MNSIYSSVYIFLMQLSQKRYQKELNHKYASSCDFYNHNEDYLNKINKDSSALLDTSYSPSKQISYNSFIFEAGSQKKERFRLRNLRNIDLTFYREKKGEQQEYEDKSIINKKGKNQTAISPSLQLKANLIKQSSAFEGRSPSLRNKKYLKPKKKINDLLSANINIYGNRYVVTPPLVDFKNQAKFYSEKMQTNIRQKQKKSKRVIDKTVIAKDDEPITGWA